MRTTRPLATRRRPKPAPAKVDEWGSLAATYHENVITPFDPAVDFRLPGDVRRILQTWWGDGTVHRRVVIDFGCGTGETLALVAGKVGLAVGLDLSEAMLDQCEHRLRHAGLPWSRFGAERGLHRLTQSLRAPANGDGREPRTVLATGDLLRLSPLRERADLALAINSVCPPSAAQARRMIAGIAASLRPGGTLIMVLPSLDSLAYLHDLFVQRDGAPPSGESIDTRHGLYRAASGETQKYFTPADIDAMLADNGLKRQRVEKILYPWPLIRRYGWGNFPRRERMWDWYVAARSVAAG